MTRPMPSVSLLDNGALPVADLARIAMREGVRPRDSTRHTSGLRDVLLSLPALCLSVRPATARKSFWRAFYKGDAWSGRTVLDPFVGGGVMLLEATRLGASVRGVDVEPVAAAIARFQTTLRDLPDLNAPLKALSETIGMELASYYHAQDADGRSETLLHAFWVQSVSCERCGLAFDAHPRFRLAWSDVESRRGWRAAFVARSSKLR